MKIPIVRIVLSVFALLGCITGRPADSSADVATLDQDLRLHIPLAVLDGNRLWADLALVPTTDGSIIFSLTGAGAVSGDPGGAPEDTVTIDQNLHMRVPRLVAGDAEIWAYMDFLPGGTSARSSESNAISFEVSNWGLKESWDQGTCREQGEIEVIYHTSVPVISAATRFPFCVTNSGSVVFGSGILEYDESIDLGDGVTMRRFGSVDIRPTGSLGNTPGPGGVVQGLVFDPHGYVTETTEMKLVTGQVLMSYPVSTEWDQAMIAMPLIRD